jgi:hypothetical protein
VNNSNYEFVKILKNLEKFNKSIYKINHVLGSQMIMPLNLIPKEQLNLNLIKVKDLERLILIFIYFISDKYSQYFKFKI